MGQQIYSEIEQQMKLDTDTLLVMLGTEGSVGATPGTPGDGKIVLENIKKRFKEKICESENVRKAYEKSGASRTVVATAILDCISGALTGVSPITASVLLAREGVGTLCEEIWSES